MNAEISCLREYIDNLFAFCLEMWDVIWKMRFRFVFCKNCLSDSFSWSCLIISSSVIFDRLVSLFSEWRMLILDYRVTHVCSRSVERHLWESDSSNMTKASHQTWWKKRHLIKFDEKASSHQIWRKRLIKLSKRETILLFSDKQSFAATLDMKNLVLQKVIFDVKCLCKIVMINERS
jgi:hypothetical protein